MKKFFLSAALFCGLSAFAADPYFEQTIKHVDTGGETLNYQNITTITAELDKELPEVAAGFFKHDVNTAVQVKSVTQVVLRLLDLPSFKAVAASSKQVAPEVFVLKQAIVHDQNSKSILINPDGKNVQLDWQNLPANTRLAIMFDPNLPRIWARLKTELAATQNAHILQFLADIPAEINEYINNSNGAFSLLITGNNLQDLNAKLEIPDQNGAIAQRLRVVFPPQRAQRTCVIPTPVRNLHIVYAEKKIVVATDALLLMPPEQTLASLPKFREYAKYLPASGNGYLIVNMPQDVTDFINLIKPELQLNIQPFSFVAVGNKISNGEVYTIASDYSLIHSQALAVLRWVKIMQAGGAFNK